jgi:hypothetical protein
VYPWKIAKAQQTLPLNFTTDALIPSTLHKHLMSIGKALRIRAFVANLAKAQLIRTSVENSKGSTITIVKFHLGCTDTVAFIIANYIFYLIEFRLYPQFNSKKKQKKTIKPKPDGIQYIINSLT